MDIKCPHCGTEYEVEKQDMYHYTKCEVCGKGFVLGATASHFSSNNSTAPMADSSPVGLNKAAIQSAASSAETNWRKILIWVSIICGCLMAVLVLVIVMLCCNIRGAEFRADENNSHIVVAQSVKESTTIESPVNAQIAQPQEPAAMKICNDEAPDETNSIELCDNEDGNDRGSNDNDVSDDDKDSENQTIDDDDGYNDETENSKVVEEGAVDISDAQGGGVTKEEPAMKLVERVCAGNRLTYKEWEVRLRSEIGIEKLKNSLDAEFSRSGYSATRVESSGIAILVGRLTDSVTGFIREGLDGGFTYPIWLPEHDAEYIYKAFLRLEAMERYLLKRAEVYDRAFKNSGFYITPEEEERIEQEKRHEYAQPLFASICLIPKRYFCVQKRLGMSILSAKITDWRWKKLCETQSKGDWLGMMSIIEYDDGDKKFEKYPEEKKIASLYEKILNYDWNVEIKLRNTGVSSPGIIDRSDYREIDDSIRRGVSEKEVAEIYSTEQYVNYTRFNAALKKMSFEFVPYSIDLQVRIIKVDRDGSTKNIDGGNDKPSRQKPIEFQFTIEAGAFHLLIVDDEWYWRQRISDSLRGKMAKYVDIQNAYYSEMAKIGDAVRNKKQYNKADGISLRNGVVDKYRQQLLDAISEFLGKKIELPPDCVQPAKIEKEDIEERSRPYQPLHDEDDDAMSESDMLSYRILANRGNRFKEYSKEIEEQERKQKEMRREELRLKGPGELNGSRGIGVSGRGRDGRKEKLRLKGPGE
ncbi:MAG: hypothetical protein IKJ45_18150, partial [Kiritimatiellae bacterium]|nr:hypothetical protein [Kiritimatiellia bacterium]